MVWVIEVVEYSSGGVVKELEYGSERKADKADDGLQYQINHDRFYTRIVSRTGARREGATA